MTDPDVVAAWDAVHDALAALPGWEAARPSYHGEERLWVAYAHDARHTHGRQPHTFVESRGMTEEEALLELAVALRGRTNTT